jgi:putative sugar O-methyltransferase
MTVETSKLWQSLSATLFANVDDDFVRTFRRAGGANSRLGAWDPFDRTMRYFKFMLYAAAERRPDRFFEHYQKLGRVDLGEPVSVHVRDCAINIDYLLGVDEFMFIENAIDVAGLRSVVEIGAGFGRTAHAMMALTGGSLERYTIVDLSSVLALSRRVLAEVVPDQFDKIRFIAAEDVAAWRNLKADLAINIDSFQEMPPATIERYMSDIILGCRHFYVSNPVAKYSPESLGVVVQNPAQLNDVFALGLCHDVIDVFDDRALGRARLAYIDAYRPAPSWSLVADRPQDMFPYYHHALYRAP